MKRAHEEGGEIEEPVAKRARAITYPPPSMKPYTGTANYVWGTRDKDGTFQLFVCDLSTTMYHREIVDMLEEAGKADRALVKTMLRYLAMGSPLPAHVFARYFAQLPPDQLGTWSVAITLTNCVVFPSPSARCFLPPEKPTSAPPETVPPRVAETVPVLRPMFPAVQALAPPPSESTNK